MASAAIIYIYISLSKVLGIGQELGIRQGVGILKHDDGGFIVVTKAIVVFVVLNLALVSQQNVLSEQNQEGSGHGQEAEKDDDAIDRIGFIGRDPWTKLRRRSFGLPIGNHFIQLGLGIRVGFFRSVVPIL